MGIVFSKLPMFAPKTLLLLAGLVVAAQAAFTSQLDGQWEQFKTKYAKAYPRTVESRRRLIWEDNHKFIQEHNAKYAAGLESYEVGENEFNDMTNEEFVSMMNGLRYSETSERLNPVFSPSLDSVPEKVDWREEGYVTGVKNQGQCGSCWAFSATGALEGAHFAKTKQLVSLSEQNLVDCSSRWGNHGCNGGLMDFAFKYIKDNKGIDTEESYPYTAKQGHKCLFNKENIGATLTSWTDVKSRSEEDLEAAVATVGPVSVAIDAGHRGFQMYKSGVYHELLCSSTRMNHGVLAVGYGSIKNWLGKEDKYWIVKNSWGTSWGNKGYINMAKEASNMCGIATAASFPVV